jgi:hypothetical protein
MPKLIISGSILPPVVRLSLHVDLEIKWPIPEANLEITFRPQIKDSIVTIECEADRIDSSDFMLFYMRALDITRGAVNLIGFAKGWGVTVFLESVLYPNGRREAIVLADPRMPPLCTSFRIDDKTLQDALQIVIGDSALSMALDDLIVAITVPHASAINCARVVESLRVLISPPDCPPKKSWPILRDTLRISQPYLEFITTYSTAPRHGDRRHIPGDVTNELTRRTWIVMDRFLHYRKRGNQPLPESEFPMLSS